MRSRVKSYAPFSQWLFLSLLLLSLSLPSIINSLPIIPTTFIQIETMTRSHKLNDREHPVEGTMGTRDNLPRYFGKTGPTDADPRKTKKDGGGKGNWGRSGDEMQDTHYSFANARRHSNSSTHGLSDFNTKFEGIDQEPVFEEEDYGDAGMTNESNMTKVDSASSNSSEAERRV
ncbi:uncharacterized protein N7515_002916 [Penicillium bovifimosum]|uniref:Hyaluronan/mRNA-binding protein domain-containing protein n=1 Tax=Penicillium bovifimosum TaxID=126998 RepID=A0A9W9HCM1_9EURO|nr:uncharacterized protein N7515_002916 [Penicillium bovifimosum]KAJ5144129.1 hypothetical protein N7515_002916 [Penicillium bovifimosum]